MSREKDRELRRRQRRRAKLRTLKARLSETRDSKERQRLAKKIIKISVSPSMELPRE